MAVDPKLLRMADQIASKYGIPKNLFRALIRQESGWNPRAGSHAGAQGLTQLMPGTARGLGVTNILDPRQNLEGGAKYLADQKRRFGKWDLALSAYNSGPGGSEGSGRVEGFSETQNYVKNILGSLGGGGVGPVVGGPTPAPRVITNRQGSAAPVARQGLSAATLGLIFQDDPDMAATLSRLASTRAPSQPGIPARTARGKAPTKTPALDQVKAQFGPQAMLAIIAQAQKLGLRVGENPYTDKVDPVHVKGSHHYRNFGKFNGKQLGRGADISGSPDQMAQIFKWIRSRYPQAAELIYDPIGASFDGSFRPGAYGGHKDHVHVGL